MLKLQRALLASAAGIVAVAGAQAADLPTRKGAPAAEYVKVCKVDGVAGFIIPGSDTCLKITGYAIAMATAGNLSKQYTWTGNETVLKPGATTKSRDEIGMDARGELEFIAKSNTAYGVLTSDIDTQFNYGNGYDNGGTGVLVNHAFLNWAGITAGKANSFFSFFGAGPAWADIFSADRQSYNQPLLLAYTATFGGGFSATVSLEDPRGGNSGNGTQDPTALNIGGGGSSTQIAANSTYDGLRSPDIVASVDLAQSWGGAHLAGVAHNVIMTSVINDSSINKWGWAVDGGVKFNLPTLGAGDNVQLQGSWSRNDVWYSGIPGAMWDEGGQVNGNGVYMPLADAFSNANGTWATPTAWTIEAISEFHFGPTFSIDPEVGYGQLHWSNNDGVLATNSESWMGGAIVHWDPAAHIDFAIELLYQSTHQSTPAAYDAAASGTAWKSNTDGLESRLMITRDF